jgi:polysaccharide export outer membrane protein
VVYRDPIVRTTIFIDRLAAPFQTVLNSMLQYSFVDRSIKSLGVPLFGGAGATTTRGTGTSALTPQPGAR